MGYPRYTYRAQIWHIFKGLWVMWRKRRKGKKVRDEAK